MFSRLYSPRKNREDGFTLVELLIVVIIIGILAAISLPIFLNQQKAANDGSVQSDVRNTVDSVQTFLVKNSGTAYANTGAYVAAGGTATISNGNTVGVNINADGSYQVCGYVTSGSGNQFKSASAAFTYTTSGTGAGTFTSGSCLTGSTTGGTAGASAAPTTVASYDFSTGTQTWFAGAGTSVYTETVSGKTALGFSGGTVHNYPGAQANISGFTVGKSYTMSALVFMGSGSQMFVTGGSGTNDTDSSHSSTSTSGSWVPVSDTFKATATTINPYVIILPAGTSNTGYGDVTNIQFTQN